MKGIEVKSIALYTATILIISIFLIITFKSGLNNTVSLSPKTVSIADSKEFRQSPFFNIELENATSMNIEIIGWNASCSCIKLIDVEFPFILLANTKRNIKGKVTLTDQSQNYDFLLQILTADPQNNTLSQQVLVRTENE
ncbi:hypothetical protein [uncultured Gimesia sp.]|uniref:hypothetical protein n=1 Tax=uncultured Gimesia sp. TaxID=1678688 RepID=UPI0030D97E82|tara:strand:+ start:42855 stop:43274 length:420 start_codon:yes stop_codon:yes gene_type:complete